jgi:hypothetical protein
MLAILGRCPVEHQESSSASRKKDFRRRCRIRHSRAIGYTETLLAHDNLSAFLYWSSAAQNGPVVRIYIEMSQVSFSAGQKL